MSIFKQKQGVSADYFHIGSSFLSKHLMTFELVFKLIDRLIETA